MANRYWHTLSGDDAAAALRETVASIRADHSSRYQAYADCASAYHERHIAGFEPEHIQASAEDALAEPLAYNVTRSCIDTVTSKITAQKPAPKILPSAALENAQERARDMEQFLLGSLHASKAYPAARLAFRDSPVYGIGWLKAWSRGNSVAVTRVHPARMAIDDRSVVHGRPTVFHQDDFLPRELLEMMFKGNRKALKIIAEAKAYEASTANNTRDLLQVWEGWTENHGQPGRHVLAIENGCLADEAWEGCAPFVMMPWTTPDMGLHGPSGAEQLRGIQAEINQLLRKVQLNMDLLSQPYIIAPIGCDIPDGHLGTNAPARILRYAGGVPPRVETPPAVHPQVFQQIENLYAKGFELFGVSMLSATSQKPAGVESGIGLMTLQDVETQRFAEISRQWEEAFVDIAARIIDVGKRSAASWSVQGHAKDTLRKIKWSEISMADDMYQLQVYPASSLPRHPVGRNETIIRYAERGFISPQEGRAMLEMPDLDKSNRLASAEQDVLEALFEDMLRDGQYRPPTIMLNLTLGIELARKYYARALVDGADPTRAALLETWTMDAMDTLQPPLMAPADPMAMGPMASTGGPEAPPMAPVTAIPNEPPEMPPEPMPGMGG